MTGRPHEREIVLLGASGYTGRLVAAELLRIGARPVLAGRNREKLRTVRDALDPTLEVRLADAASTHEVAQILEPESVLVSTAGPFFRVGDAPVRAAIETKSHYLDSAGEPGFHALMLAKNDDAARNQGSALLTGFGTEWVLGNLAGELALERCPAPASIQVGYFLRHGEQNLGAWKLARAFAAASLASGVGLASQEGLRWHGGALEPEPWARRVGGFGAGYVGVSTGGTEHFALPRSYPSLEDVEVYLGWFGRASRAVAVIAPVVRAAVRRPSIASRVERLAQALGGSAPRSGLGAGGGVTSLTLARAYPRGGGSPAEVELRGGDLYSLTARFLAWGAVEAAQDRLSATGVAGPVQALGLERLSAAARSFGLDWNASARREAPS